MAERNCGIRHITIEEAIIHAEQSLGSFRKPAEPYWGTMRGNSTLVVGFQLSSRKRWRLDYDPNPANEKWVHVNEENFDASPSDQKIVHLVDNKNYIQVDLYYRKWTKRYR
ncbi:MAG TPA: hypothetical protein VKU19_21980 [Bryobacteraceae bacterium]|nr:hypothetical protein [Bryobacteraceae bacterium]